jgi:regulator of protease activity HflC (stomatin/prohibitin superfamily)
MTMNRETVRRTVPGWAMLPTLILAEIGLLYLLITTVIATDGSPGFIVVPIILALVFGAFLFLGFFIVNPNDAKALLLFGKYGGTVKQAGFHWANPLFVKKRLSLRVRNFESSKIKVNDHDGNPIEIAAVVVWRVVDSYEALFEVDDYQHYVQVQSEGAMRNLATQYPYDTHIDGEKSLRGDTLAIADQLKAEVQERLAQAGVAVLEARINHLAYAPEIASAMLQRQQAGAIIAARQRIVEGAVGMVEMALEMLSQRDVVELDNDRKAAMVSNLLVVLCGDRSAQPVVNTGTIYQ